MKVETESGCIGCECAECVRRRNAATPSAHHAWARGFTAWNAGHKIETTPEREWRFVVGTHGLDRSTWTFDVSGAEPVVEEGMLVDGSNAKNLKMAAPAPEPEASGGSYPHSFHEPHMA